MSHDSKTTVTPQSSREPQPRPVSPFAETHASGSSAASTPVPDVFPGYEIVREINRGGQGVVYLGIQIATRRRVAIKVLLDGNLASSATKKRFEREVTLVAQLRHPSVISVFDSGETEAGRQFYVMDYVPGTPLTRYVRENKLSLDAALKLFQQICDAVQYAHSRGIVHRDLKPSNILIDTDGTPKILDFGLAKWLAGPTDAVLSLSAELIGTLPYMAPEQARGQAALVDARTDIYALGVILYEILTGHYPYPVAGAMATVLRIIAEEPPTSPRRRWDATSGISRRSIESRREKSNPIDEHIEAIVLMALSKERERRYQSAEDFAADVARYLRGEPIQARKDSLFYRFRQRLRRNRKATFAWGVGGGAALVAVMTALYFWLALGTAGAAAAGAAKAATLIGAAELHLKDRSGLDKARALLGEAERLAPQLPELYYRRAQLHVLDAFGKPRLDKPAAADLALRDFEQAFIKSGGVPFASLAAGSATAAGYPQALWEAADICAVLNRGDDLKKLLEAFGATPLNRESIKTGRAGRVKLFDFDASKFSPQSESPQALGLEPDTAAEVSILLRDEIRTLDPLSNRAPAPYLVELVYDSLATFDHEMNCVWNMSLLAREPTSADKVTWQFELRPEAVWHDGEPVTAVDVERSWRLLFYTKWDGIAAIRPDAGDPRRFAIELTEAWGDHAAEMSFMVLPARYFEDVPAAATLPPERRSAAIIPRLLKKPIGSGPYRVAAAELAPTPDRIELERFDRYPGRKPLIQRLVFSGASAAAERARRLESERIDAGEITLDDFRWSLIGPPFDEKYLRVFQPLTAYDFILWSRAADSPLADERVRKAVAFAIDLPAVAELDFESAFKPFRGLWGNSAWADRPERRLKLLAYNRQNAKELLDAAGWKLDPGATVRTRDGKPLTIRLPVDASMLSMQRVAARIRQYLADVHVAVETPVESWGFAAYSKLTGEGKADGVFKTVITNPTPLMDRVRWTPGANDSSNFANDSQWDDEAVTRAFGDARRAAQPSGRIAALLAAEQKIYEAQPYLFLWEKPTTWVFSRRLHGVRFSPLGPLRFRPGICDWWVPQR